MNSINPNNEEILSAAMNDLEEQPSVISKKTTVDATAESAVFSSPIEESGQVSSREQNHLKQPAKSDNEQSSAEDVNQAIKTAAKAVSSKVTATMGKKSKKTYIIIAVCAFAAIVLLLIVTNIHKCDECEKVYFGKQYKVSWFGEHEKICRDCYEDWF